MIYFVHGKPGSGKSCYVVSLIWQMLLDWARYKIQHGEEYPRILYCNIPLYVEEINAALSKELGQEIDLSEQIVVLEEEFFYDDKGEMRDWWEDFPQRAYLVLDEFHRYLPSDMKKDPKGRKQGNKFTQFSSMHRHMQLDVILLSQHIDKVGSDAKKDIHEVFEVLNVKGAIVGFWPFTVPMSDIDVVRESWGLPVQFAHIKRGVMEAKKVAYDKVYKPFVLTPFLFSLYRSHTLSEEPLDRPSLRLGRIGSVIWLVRRHVFRLGFWTIMLVSGFFGVRNVMSKLPGALVESMIPKQAAKTASTVAAVPLSTVYPGEPGHVHGAHCTHSTTAAPAVEDDKIIGFVRGGVITPKGVLRKDDHLIVDGEKDYVSAVDMSRGILYLGSGKKVQK